MIDAVPGMRALLTIYAKNKREDLTDDDRQTIREAIGASRVAPGDDTAR